MYLNNLHKLIRTGYSYWQICTYICVYNNEHIFITYIHTFQICLYMLIAITDKFYMHRYFGVEHII